MLSEPSLFKMIGALQRLQEEALRMRASKVSFADELVLSEAEIEALLESISRARSAQSSSNFNRPLERSLSKATAAPVGTAVKFNPEANTIAEAVV